jgi:hypothetical protein
MRRAPLPHTTTMPPAPAAHTVPGAAGSAGSGRARQILSATPSMRVRTPGVGLKARTCRSISCASLPQSISASLVSMRAAYVASASFCGRAAGASARARSSNSAPSAASLSWSAPAVSSADIGSGACNRIGPVSRDSSICMIVAPVTVSPASRARWMGAAPRQRGNSEAWTLIAPRGAARSSVPGRIRP